MAEWSLDIGAAPVAGGVSFRVWAPFAGSVCVIKAYGDREDKFLLTRNGEYFEETVAEMTAEDRYWYLIDGEEKRPDPASRCQPAGVHGPSQVVDPAAFTWSDGDWRGIELAEMITYELHVGTFTPEGTFAAVINRLDYLRGLGITAVELMPVAQFPGSRNWGYDGVFPFAPQRSYGGHQGLKELVDACHRKGLAVVLDVVYNHLGPEGNYLNTFGPYFTDRYRTPWGDAVNFDGPYSDGVRHYVVTNALHWICEYHVDALRLDAIHGIFDFSSRHILQELAETVHRQAAELGRTVQVIAESDLNDVRTITPSELGGHGLDAQWNDDFHHALRTLLTGERQGYYVDFGEFSQLVKAFREGFVNSGQYSNYRKRRHGSSSATCHLRQFVVFSQNHDQVGNRMRGDRLSAVLSFEQLKLVAGAVIISPYLPLLFMGEEYGEIAPFPYFVSHGDPELVEAVRQGRREGFASFAWEGEVPDPQAVETFLSAKLDPELHRQGTHRHLFELYRKLIHLRKELPPLHRLSREETEITGLAEERVLIVHRRAGSDEALCLFNFSDVERSVTLPIRHGPERKHLDSADTRWGGPGTRTDDRLPAGSAGPAVVLAPFSFALYSTG